MLLMRYLVMLRRLLKPKDTGPVTIFHTSLKYLIMLVMIEQLRRWEMNLLMINVPGLRYLGGNRPEFNQWRPIKES